MHYEFLANGIEYRSDLDGCTRTAGGDVVGLPPRVRRCLLVFLSAAAGGERVTRERLSTLWDGESTDHAVARLVGELRRAIPGAVGDGLSFTRDVRCVGTYGDARMLHAASGVAFGDWVILSTALPPSCLRSRRQRHSVKLVEVLVRTHGGESLVGYALRQSPMAAANSELKRGGSVTLRWTVPRNGAVEPAFILVGNGLWSLMVERNKAAFGDEVDVLTSWSRGWRTWARSSCGSPESLRRHAGRPTRFASRLGWTLHCRWKDASSVLNSQVS